MPSTPAHDAPEVQVVSSLRVSCDGGEGALGHPRIWMSIPPEIGWAECGYCDKRFVLEGTPEAARLAAEAPDKG